MRCMRHAGVRRARATNGVSVGLFVRLKGPVFDESLHKYCSNTHARFLLFFASLLIILE